jgi:hypothetical protein
MIYARLHESESVIALDRREVRLQLAKPVEAGPMLSNVMNA